MRTLLFLFAALYFTTAAQAQNPNSKILGVWWNEEKSSRIEVFEKDGKIYGKIVWMRKDSNPDGTTPRKDFNNDDEKLQSRPLVGMVILQHLEWDEDDNEWDDGKIYDPASGDTFSCYAKLQKDGKIYMKGYILGMPFMGRSTLWTRYTP